MTPNQLALLIDIYVGRYYHKTEDAYPATLTGDLVQLRQEELIQFEHEWLVTMKGRHYICAACRIHIEEQITLKATIKEEQ